MCWGKQPIPAWCGQLPQGRWLWHNTFGTWNTTVLNTTQPTHSGTTTAVHTHTHTHTQMTTEHQLGNRFTRIDVHLSNKNIFCSKFLCQNKFVQNLSILHNFPHLVHYSFMVIIVCMRTDTYTVVRGEEVGASFHPYTSNSENFSSSQYFTNTAITGHQNFYGKGITFTLISHYQKNIMKNNIKQAIWIKWL